MAVRSSAADVFQGDGEWGSMALAWKLQPLLLEEAALPHPASLAWRDAAAQRAQPELQAIAKTKQVRWVLRPWTGLALGTASPFNQGGDEEEGLLSLRAGAEVSFYGVGIEATAEPQLGFDVGAGVAQPSMMPRSAWLAWRGEHLLAGFGMRDRWLGPGRHGSLMLSDNARPPPMGTLAGFGHLPGKAAVLGNWRFETSVGWLQRPRDDVDHPGLLLMDLRWLPLPVLELGATRMSIFGGEGRPMPSLWQMIYPSDPHVYDDPEREEPDQNEIASLDFRVCLPISQWAGGPVDWLEAWWEYGGEDMIVRNLGGLKYPALAGVANIYGIEAAAGPLVLTVEKTRILDDYFRWYTGHRVYHDGFTQDGRVMGHHIGGDADSLWLRAGWFPMPWGVEAWFENLLRVGVIEAEGKNLQALSTDERTWRLGGRFWRMLDVGEHAAGEQQSGGGHLGVSYRFERTTGADFVPGAERFDHRLALVLRFGPLAARDAGVTAAGEAGP